MVVVEPKSQQTHVYEFPSLRPICVLPVGKNSPAKLSADGSLLAINTGKDIQLWDVKKVERKFSWPVSPTAANDPGFLDISPDGKFVLGVPASSTVSIWSAESGKRISQTRGIDTSSPLAFTEDSKLWVSFFQNKNFRGVPESYEMQPRELRTGRITASTSLGVLGQVYAAQLLRDNRLVASAGYGAATISFPSSYPEPTIARPIGDIAPPGWREDTTTGALAWSSDARFVLGNTDLYRGSADSITFIRKFHSGTSEPPQVAVLSTPLEPSQSAAYSNFPNQSFILSSYVLPVGGMFSRDNQFVYVITHSGKLLTWRLNQLKWSPK